MLKLSTLLATVCLFSVSVMAADKTGETAGQGNPPSNTDCPDPMTKPCGDRGAGDVTELWLLDVSAGHENFCYTLKTPLKLTDSAEANRHNKTPLLRDTVSLKEEKLSWSPKDKTFTLDMTKFKNSRYLLEIGENSVALHEVPDGASSKKFLDNGCTAQSKFISSSNSK